MIVGFLFVVFLIAQLSTAKPKVNYQEDVTDNMHTYEHILSKRGTNRNEELLLKNVDWAYEAQNTLKSKLKQIKNENLAKNVIFFLGDGLSIPTSTAARVYLGNSLGNSGEEIVLAYEEFPFTGLSKTYCVNSQVADSACSATAYLCGVKANIGTIGVTADVELQKCNTVKESTHMKSIVRWAQLAGKKTGIVTTTRITHASPAGTYAHVAFRDWESDKDLMSQNVDFKECPDIAYQLIHGETGKNFNVILGGGRVKLLPKHIQDEEGFYGERLDGRNLIKEWIQNKEGSNAEYVWNRSDLQKTSNNLEYLLGLFESSHCKYNIDREDSDPTLEEMTEKAINMLSSSENGYFLFIEGGRIDHGHHEVKAQKALNETVEFSKAIKKARKITSEKDTLIVVTADHSHTMSISGYPTRGNDILGFAGIADDDIPYSTLTYANGPIEENLDICDKRKSMDPIKMRTKDYLFPVLAKLKYETHGGDDVGIYASGPWSHLFTGVLEQNVIPHLIGYASCIGNGTTFCDI